MKVLVELERTLLKQLLESDGVTAVVLGGSVVAERAASFAPVGRVAELLLGFMN
jgi:hypothetical protein